MRVLWLSVTPSLYAASNVAHNGGGWIESLERLVGAVPDIELAVAFEHDDCQFQVSRDRVTYYPIRVNRTLKNRILKRVRFELEEKNIVLHCLKIIDNFKPDVVHVFGSEWSFGLVAQHTEVPVVIHMQGSLPAYYNARLPPGFSTCNVARHSLRRLGDLLRYLGNDVLFRLKAEREERLLAGCKYFMGRTEWDRAIVTLHQPRARYFHCDEVLRPEFYAASGAWTDSAGRSKTIISVISSPLYKGMDTVLKSARLLKRHAQVQFDWRVYGVSECHLQEAITGIRASEVNVRLMGVAPAAKIRAELAEATTYVHASYIDNSPNSLCEAQLVGTPVIAANVGGIGSLIEHDRNGLLVSANDPYMLAFRIAQVFQDSGLRARLSANATRTARARHSPEKILSDLIGIYRELASSQ